MAEGLEFHWLKAPLLRRGSSSAQGVGGRVRTPAPMAYSEALSFFRRGALCAPAGGQRPPLRRKTDRERWLANSGADLEPHQGQILQTQGPVAREKSQTATQILRAGNFAWTCRYASPVMGSGADSPCQGEMARRARGGRVGDYEHEVLIWSRPRWRFAQSLVAPGEAQRSGFAGKRRSKGTNAVFAARRKRSGVDFATTSRHGQSRPPPAGGGIPCA